MPGSSKTPLLIFANHLDKGGLEEIVLYYAKLLDKKTFAVTIACFTAGQAFNEIKALPDVSAIHINTRSPVQRFLRLWKLARTVNPEIVHDHSTSYGVVIGRLVGAKTVETIHNRLQWFNWHERIRFGLYCRCADRVIAVAESVKKFSIEFFPFVKPESFVVIRNAVDARRFSAESSADTLRDELGIRLDEIVIGFVGRLAEQKGVTYLLHAAAHLSEQFHNLRFVIVGDGELQTDLAAQKDFLRLTNTIFVGFQRNTARYYRMFDIFVLPSLFEGLPVSALEAMAAECPVVATAVSGTVEAVDDGVTGFLVEPKTILQLKEKLAILVVDPELRKRMGKAGRERVERLFSAEMMVKETERLYKELLSQ